MDNDSHSEARQADGAEETPEVYAVQNDLTGGTSPSGGWRFSRRDFLAAASAAAAATVAGAAAGCAPATPQPTPYADSDAAAHAQPGRKGKDRSM